MCVRKSAVVTGDQSASGCSALPVVVFAALVSL